MTRLPLCVLVSNIVMQFFGILLYCGDCLLCSSPVPGDSGRIRILHGYLQKYVYIYICIYIYIFTCMSLSIYLFLVRLFVSLSIGLYLTMYLCTYIHM